MALNQSLVIACAAAEAEFEGREWDKLGQVDRLMFMARADFVLNKLRAPETNWAMVFPACAAGAAIALFLATALFASASGKPPSPPLHQRPSYSQINLFLLPPCESDGKATSPLTFCKPTVREPVTIQIGRGDLCDEGAKSCEFKMTDLFRVTRGGREIVSIPAAVFSPIEQALFMELLSHLRDTRACAPLTMPWAPPPPQRLGL
jgi:hypothetical protein